VPIRQLGLRLLQDVQGERGGAGAEIEYSIHDYPFVGKIGILAKDLMVGRNIGDSGVQLKVSVFMIGRLHTAWNFKLRGAGDAFSCTPQFSVRHEMLPQFEIVAECDEFPVPLHHAFPVFGTRPRPPRQAKTPKDTP
jgi:hypothetical protein